MATTKKEETVIIENNNPNPNLQPNTTPIVEGQAVQPTNPTANVYQNTMQNIGANNNNNNNITADDYYNNLRQENYRALLSKEIQLANAKQNAMKATQNQLAGLGMANSGYGAIQSTGIANNYLNAMAGAQQNYITQQNTINEQQRQEQLKQSESNFNSMVSVLTQADSVDTLSTALSNFGITYDPKTGTMSGAGWDKLSPDMQTQLLASVNMKQKSLEQSDWIAENTIDDGYSDSGSAIANVTDPYGDKGNTSNELRFIFEDSYMGNSPDGKVVKLENKKHGDRHVFMIKYGNKWYKTTGAVYEKARREGRPTDFIKGK